MMKEMMEKRAVTLNEMLEERGATFSLEVHEKVRPNGMDVGYVMVQEHAVCSPVIYYAPEWWELDDERVVAYFIDLASEVIIDGEFPDISSLFDRGSILELVQPKVMDLHNLALMQSHGYACIGFEDLQLMVGFYLALSDEFSLPMQSTMIDNVGITMDELYQAAMKNFRKDVVHKPLASVLNELFNEFSNNHSEEPEEELKEPEEPEEEPMEEYDYENLEFPIIMATRRNKIYGAAAILDTDTLDEIVDKIGDVYILPSSIHEVLLVPIRFWDPVTLRAMVSEVNSNQVEECEKLNDLVYQYRDGILSIAD